MTQNAATASDARVWFDTQMMRIALRMAKRGLGTTAYNPSVGAVIADEETGEVIARGWTQPGGRPHAEKEALRRAGERARGMTMYLTLEPCAHTGRLPTCADAVLTSGLKRVVCAQADPNPIVSGHGFQQLIDAGVIVDVGLLADDARWVTAGHILSKTIHRPFVQMKIAVSADGRIAKGKGKPVWVTGPQARAHGHLLRAEANAIVVGVGTVLADDPELTCRLPGLAHRSPDRVVLDSRLSTPTTAKVLWRQGEKARVWIMSAISDPANAVRDASPLWMAGNLVLSDLDRPGSTSRVDVRAALDSLEVNDVRRVLVEGGPRVWQSFLAEDLVDEVVLYRSGTVLGDAGVEPLGPNGLGVFEGPAWMPTDERPLGTDRMIVYRRLRRGVRA
jgi:diaminohydroxyphosphoribosylaminopyrimidine deaminase/5-amino-6-(5-phosphoribosylamino)uracil reductase